MAENKAYVSEEAQPVNDVALTESSGAEKGPDSPPVSPEHTAVDLKSEEEKGKATKPYAGMGKEDLLRFSHTPFWNRLRMTCLILFWLAWLALLGAVIGLTIVFPRCKAPPSETWWQNTNFYQVYIRSFYDANGDGVGDLKGLEAKLDYIKLLKSEAIIVSSIYQSPPGGDLGYDVTNHTTINPEYGSMADFDSFLNAAHEKGLKVIMDFIPNHTGDKHFWFTESKKSSDRNNEYRNYYVWADCGNGTTPPNNWLSVYGNSSWTYDVTRKQCYLHHFLKEEPELNLRSAQVREQLEAILRFWLDKGVDGFRVTSASFLFEDYDLRNELPSGKTNDENDYDYLDHKYTRAQPEIYDLIARWRSLLDEYSTEQYRILLTEAKDDINETMKYYGTYGRSGAHLPLNYELTKANSSCGGRCMMQLADNWIYKMPRGSVADWLTGDQDSPRIGSIRGQHYVNALLMLRMTLPGTSITYYGEEIGMVDANLTHSDQKDPVWKINPRKARDSYRTPMQWTNETHGGFVNGSGTPWLPVTADYPSRNVEAQNGIENSVLHLYKELANAKEKYGSLKFGHFHISTIDDNFLSFLRDFDGQESILVAINFGTTTVTLKQEDDYRIPSRATVLLNSHNSEPTKDQEININDVKLAPAQGIILQWPFSRG